MYNDVTTTVNNCTSIIMNHDMVNSTREGCWGGGWEIFRHIYLHAFYEEDKKVSQGQVPNNSYRISLALVYLFVTFLFVVKSKLPSYSIFGMKLIKFDAKDI